MSFYRKIKPYVESELDAARQAETSGDPDAAFGHLENAHVLGQRSTRHHTRVHFRMLLWAIRHRLMREVRGQLFRIVGAATKTSFGLVPAGNTGGANVSPWKRMPVRKDHAALIEQARTCSSADAS